MSRHAHLFKGVGGDFKPEVASKARWIEQFDEAITRVSFGWPSVAAYYAGEAEMGMIKALIDILPCPGQVPHPEALKFWAFPVDDISSGTVSGC